MLRNADPIAMSLSYLLIILCYSSQALAKVTRGRGGSRSASRPRSGYGGGNEKFTLVKKMAFFGKPSKQFAAYMKGAAFAHLPGHNPTFYFSPLGYGDFTHEDNQVCIHKFKASEIANSFSTVTIENITVTNGFITSYYLCDAICCDGDCCEKYWQTSPYLQLDTGETFFYMIIVVAVVGSIPLVIIPLAVSLWDKYDDYKLRKRKRRQRTQEEMEVLDDIDEDGLKQTRV